MECVIKKRFFNMSAVFTYFNLFNIILNKELLNNWLHENNLLIDFSSINCQLCGRFYKFYPDSYYTEGFSWRCSTKGCRRKISPKFGSWFENSNLSVETILKLTYMWCREYSNKLASIECGISEKSVVDWFNFCRDVCIDLLDSDLAIGSASDVIGGEGITVEIDESKFGKRKYHRGKHVDGVWVFGGVERGHKENCFFFVVEDRSADTLIPIIRNHIRPNTHIVSDCWAAYSQIENQGLGYKHSTVNHSENFKDPVSGEHTNNIECTWHCIKR